MQRLGRKLTRGERYLDLVGLNHDLETGKARLYRAIEKEKRRVIRELVRTGRAERMGVTLDMLAALAFLRRRGQAHARGEMKRMGVEPVKMFAYDPQLDIPAMQLGVFTTAIERRVEAEFTEASLSGVAGQALLNVVDRRVPGALDAASRLTSGALYGGLGAVYEQNGHLFPGWEYSAIMDAATCEVCRHWDGTRWDLWDQATRVMPNGGPNPSCFGDGRCRCRLVPVPPADAPEPELPADMRRGEATPAAPLRAPEARDEMLEARAQDWLLRGKWQIGAPTRAKDEVVRGIADELRDNEAFQRYIGIGGRANRTVKSFQVGEQFTSESAFPGVVFQKTPGGAKVIKTPTTEMEGSVFADSDLGGLFVKPKRIEVGDEVTLPELPGRYKIVEDAGDRWGVEALPDTGTVHPAGERIGVWKKQLTEPDDWKHPPEFDYVNYGRAGGEQLEAATSRLIKAWAETSADEHKWALAMQRAIQVEFDLPTSTLTRFESKRAWAEAMEVYDEHDEALRAFARAMYNRTQRELEAAGINELLLYRGQGLPRRFAPGQATGMYDEAIEFQPGSSFSSNYGTASMFAHADDADDFFAIVAARVPRERILGSARTGYGCLDEQEFVVLAAREQAADKAWLRVGKYRSERPSAASEFWRQVAAKQRGEKVGEFEDVGDLKPGEWFETGDGVLCEVVGPMTGDYEGLLEVIVVRPAKGHIWTKGQTVTFDSKVRVTPVPKLQPGALAEIQSLPKGTIIESGDEWFHVVGMSPEGDVLTTEQATGAPQIFSPGHKVKVVQPGKG